MAFIIKNTNEVDSWEEREQINEVCSEIIAEDIDYPILGKKIMIMKKPMAKKPLEEKPMAKKPLEEKPLEKPLEEKPLEKAWGGVKQKQVIEVPFKSRIAEIKSDQRSQAFEQLGNKDQLAQSLLKTRLCNSIQEKKECPHGDKCRFAHSEKELEFAKCFFGMQCRFVDLNQGKWYNAVGKGKCCSHIHPNETVSDCRIRLGLVKENEIQLTKTIVEKVLIREDDIPKDDIRKDVIRKDVIREDDIQGDADATPEETVLRVPKFLAVQALELAIKSGKMNIRIEILG